MPEISVDDFVKAKVNSGARVLNFAPMGSQGTIMVTGLGRSGTTMLARILHGLELEMGRYCHPNTSDDKQIQTVVRQGDWPQFEAICRERDAEYDIWAFKDPKIRSNLRGAVSVMRNPRVIVTFRDVLAVSMRNEISANAEIWTALNGAVKSYRSLLNQIQELSCPVLMLSYEKCLTRPEEMVRIIADFCGLSPTDDKIKEIAESSIQESDSRYLSYNHDGRFR